MTPLHKAPVIEPSDLAKPLKHVLPMLFLAFPAEERTGPGVRKTAQPFCGFT